MAPWHMSSYFWPFFGVIWSIFSVKNQFSHIFPAPGGSPFLTVNLTVKLARLAQPTPKVFAHPNPPSGKTLAQFLFAHGIFLF